MKEPEHPLDLKGEIFAYLRGRGCTLAESRGIVTVNTPDGATWDFTTPMQLGPDGRPVEAGKEMKA